MTKKVEVLESDAVVKGEGIQIANLLRFLAKKVEQDDEVRLYYRIERATNVKGDPTP